LTVFVVTVLFVDNEILYSYETKGAKV